MSNFTKRLSVDLHNFISIYYDLKIVRVSFSDLHFSGNKDFTFDGFKNEFGAHYPFILRKSKKMSDVFSEALKEVMVNPMGTKSSALDAVFIDPNVKPIVVSVYRCEFDFVKGNEPMDKISFDPRSFFNGEAFLSLKKLKNIPGDVFYVVKD